MATVKGHCECQCRAFLDYSPHPQLVIALMSLHTARPAGGAVVCRECRRVWPCATVEAVATYRQAVEGVGGV